MGSHRNDLGLEPTADYPNGNVHAAAARIGEGPAVSEIVTANVDMLRQGEQ